MRERCDQGKCGRRRRGGGAGRGREACSFAVAVAVAAVAENLLQTDPQQDQPAALNPTSLKHLCTFCTFLTINCRGNSPDAPRLFLLLGTVLFKTSTKQKFFEISGRLQSLRTGDSRICVSAGQMSHVGFI